jgi:hypothetical protein
MPQQAVTLVLLVMACAVVALEQFLGSGVVRGQNGVVGEVELSTQHAALHHASQPIIGHSYSSR